MVRYICKTCGRYCYSSVTDLSTHVQGDSCPYEDCNGHCAAAPYDEQEDKANENKANENK